MTRKQRTSRIAALIFCIVCSAAAQDKSSWAPDTIVVLPEVEIHEHGPARISNGEIRKLHVDDDPVAFTATAAEAFRLLPSFSTDIEGGVLFRGSNRPSVRINGIPYGLLEENSGDILIQLPALFFPKVTLNPAPDTGTLPDGSSAVLTLSPDDGFADPSPIRLILGGGWHERCNAGIATYLHPGKFRISARYDYRKEFRDRTFRKTTANAAGTTRMDNRASARPDVHTADLSVAYDVSERDILSGYGFFHRMDYSRYGAIRNTRLNPAGETINRMLRHRYNDQLQEAYAAELRWKHLFRAADTEQGGSGLELIFNYNDFAYDENNHFENESPADGKIVKQDNQFINQDKHQFYWSAAYYSDFGAGWLFKGGYIGRAADDRYASLAENLSGTDWTPDPAKTNNFTSNRLVNLLYASLHKKLNRFGLQAGLQGEHVRQKARTREDGRLADRTDLHLYPQVRLSYRDYAGGNWSVSYTERTDRPLLSELNPFIDSSDATYVRQGNPELKPEYVHLGEISYTYGRPAWRVVPSAYFRYRTNRIMDVAFADGSDVVWKKENIGDTQTAGLELAAYWQPVPRLSAGASAHVWWDQIDGRTAGLDEKKPMSCWEVKGNVKISVSPTTELQFDGFYIADQWTVQGKIDSRFTVNAALSQYLMHRKLQLHLSIQNLFDSLKEVTIIDSRTLQLRQERNRDARVAWLSLTYRL